MISRINPISKYYYLYAFIIYQRRTLTEVFHEYKRQRQIPPEKYDLVQLARRKRTEILHFCQRIYLRLRKLLYGDGIPNYGGVELSDMKKKRRKDGSRSVTDGSKEIQTLSNPEPSKKNKSIIIDDEALENVITVSSLFIEEASESVQTPIDIDKSSDTPMEKAPSNGNIYRIVIL